MLQLVFVCFCLEEMLAEFLIIKLVLKREAAYMDARLQGQEHWSEVKS